MNTDSVPTIAPINIRDAISNPPPPLEFILPGMLSGTVGAIVSPGGTGKSWLALQLAAQIAGGPDTLKVGGLPLGSVTMLAAEDPTIAILHRIHELSTRANLLERGEISDKLHIYPLAGTYPDLNNENWFQLIRDKAKESRLLIMDTLRRFHISDENDSAAMALVLGKMEQIATETSCSIVFLHHTNKSASLSGNGDSQHASRGSSVLTDNIRWQANLVTMSTNEADSHGVSHEKRRLFVKFSIAKQNYGKPLDDLWFRRTSGGLLEPMQPASTPAKKANRKTAIRGYNDPLL